MFIPHGTTAGVGVMFALVSCIFGADREGARFASLNVTMAGGRCYDYMDQGRA